jgi:hypothetical protein
MQIMSSRNSEDKGKTLTSVNSNLNSIEGKKPPGLGESTSIQIGDSVRSSEDTYREDSEVVRELNRISSSLRDTTAIMPDILRIIRQRGISKDLLSAIDELAYAVHDTTVAIKLVTKELKVC